MTRALSSSARRLARQFGPRPARTGLIRAAATSAALSCAALPALAHPHVFINATHVLLFDSEGRLAGLRTRWDYDEMFTLLMIEDGGYDSDGNGAIEGPELERFRLWDANWPPDYPGDIELTLDEAPLTLGPPGDWAAEWHAGRAVSIHTRWLEQPREVAGKALVLRPYDPGFYADYTITAAPTFEGRADCTAKVFEPDPAAVPAELAAAVAELAPDASPEDLGLPAVGRLYADEARITCGP